MGETEASSFNGGLSGAAECGDAASFVLPTSSSRSLETADILSQQGGVDILGYVSREQLDQFNGKPVLGDDGELPRLLSGHPGLGAIVAIGEPRTRERLFIRLAELGFEMLSAIHPRSSVAASARLGRGVTINAGAVVNARAVIDDGAIINTNASVSHEAEVGAFSNISPGAAVGGRVKIGKRCWIGIGASIIQGVTLGDDAIDAIIGAGAAVVRSLPASVTAAGVPCRVLKERAP